MGVFWSNSTHKRRSWKQDWSFEDPLGVLTSGGSSTLELVTLFPLDRSYKVRFNSVSSYSDARKSSGDGPDLRDNFESAGPLANVR